MPSVLWWGRFDPGYSRNRIIKALFEDLGWRTSVFRPRVSRFGWLEAVWRRPPRPDLVWVPCFRHRDVAAARRWCQRRAVPLIFDPLISSYEKDVFEKERAAPHSAAAERRRRQEAALCARANVVVADTAAHAQFFNEHLDVPAEKLGVLYVGAEAGLFEPQPYPPLQAPLEVLFFGSYLRLQGVDVIVRAAALTGDLDVRWVLLGDGDLRPAAERQARGLANVRFEPWVAYADLPRRLAGAHMLLGIFGTSPKAELVIPNKLFQSMAVGRPVITRSSSAYPPEMASGDVIAWVPPGDPEALAAQVRAWAARPGELAARGAATRRLFDACFGRDTLAAQLASVLQRVPPSGRHRHREA